MQRYVAECFQYVLWWDAYLWCLWQLEANIRDQVELHRKDAIADLERRDTAHKGWVTLKGLRKVIEKHAVPVTDEHFSE